VRTYVSDFLALRCSGDILNTAPRLHKPEKEISESMTLIQKLRGIAMDRPMVRSLVDVCAGNSLTSITSAYLLPYLWAYAFELRPRKLRKDVARFSYEQADIHRAAFGDKLKAIPEEFALTATHACGDLSRRIVDLYHETPNCKWLAIMPCCVGSAKLPRAPGEPMWQVKFGGYATWAYRIAHYAKGDFYQDEKCLSPANAVVWARKEDK